MSPYEMKILLHFYGRVHGAISELPSAPILVPTIENFVSVGLLQECHVQTTEYTHEMTSRGNCYVDGLMRVPLPEWHIPKVQDD